MPAIDPDATENQQITLGTALLLDMFGPGLYQELVCRAETGTEEPKSGSASNRQATDIKPEAEAGSKSRSKLITDRQQRYQDRKHSQDISQDQQQEIRVQQSQEASWVKH